jgi:hypothetical protein
MSCLYHLVENDEAKYSGEFSLIEKIWLYPILGLVGCWNFDSLIPKILYAAIPLWFHLFDRLGMFLKPLPVVFPFKTLYDAFPTHIRRMELFLKQQVPCNASKYK